MCLDSQLPRGFLAGLEYEDNEMMDADHLDEAVNNIFQVRKIHIVAEAG